MAPHSATAMAGRTCGLECVPDIVMSHLCPKRKVQRNVTIGMGTDIFLTVPKGV
jgi:hypothetical protein